MANNKILVFGLLDMFTSIFHFAVTMMCARISYFHFINEKRNNDDNLSNIPFIFILFVFVIVISTNICQIIAAGRLVKAGINVSI